MRRNVQTLRKGDVVLCSAWDGVREYPPAPRRLATDAYWGSFHTIHLQFSPLDSVAFLIHACAPTDEVEVYAGSA